VTTCLLRRGRGRIPVSESHILWGKSAGRCAFPSCPNKCIDLFDNSGPILLGEMAHVLASGKGGPRPAGRETRNLDRYDNLVLLCPHHHTIVDKAPADFPPKLLREWKTTLEQRISTALDIPDFKSKSELYAYATELLRDNKTILDHFGPTSTTAKSNPLSNVKEIWAARKIEQIIPNNALIVAAFKRYRSFLNQAEMETYSLFQAHALAFAANTHYRLDSVPMFPTKFSEMLTNEV